MMTRLDNSVYNYGMIKKVVDTLKDKTQNFYFLRNATTVLRSTVQNQRVEL